MSKKHRRGICWQRTEYKYPDGRKNLEKIFADRWNKENEPSPGLNRGLGTAQEIMFCSQGREADGFDGPNRDDQTFFGIFGDREVCIYNLTEREQRIILTVIQWLGTNCGFGFLQECLREGGYRIASTGRDDWWHKEMAKVREKVDEARRMRGRFGMAVRKLKLKKLEAKIEGMNRAWDKEEVERIK